MLWLGVTDGVSEMLGELDGVMLTEGVTDDVSDTVGVTLGVLDSDVAGGMAKVRSAQFQNSSGYGLLPPMLTPQFWRVDCHQLLSSGC
jgi:hypothetical protein